MTMIQNTQQYLLFFFNSYLLIVNAYFHIKIEKKVNLIFHLMTITNIM